MLVYTLTLAPGLTWAHNGADGGDLIAASFTGGVAHPPGYPVYLLLGRLFALLPLGNVPYRYNLFSALAAALAAATTAWTAQHLSGSAAGGLGAGLSLAFAPLLWEQAVIAEVYAFSALLSAIVVALSTSAPRRAWRVLALSAAFALAASHHLTLACFFPLVVFRLAQAGRALGWWSAAKATFAGVLCGLLPWVYLPLAARAPVVWGDPSTLDGVWWLVSGALYRGYAFGLPPEQMIPRIAVTAQTLASFTLPGVAAGLVGVLALVRQDRPLAWGTLIAGLGSAAFAVGYLTADSQVYLLPLLAVFAVWMGAGWGQAFAKFERVRRFLPLLILFVPVWLLARHWQAIDLSGDYAARDFVEGVAAQAPERAIVITAEDKHTFALWVSAFVERRRTDIIVVDQDMLRFDWYRASLRRSFAGLRAPESGDVGELVRQNADRPVCRPVGQPPPWLMCDSGR